MLSNGRRKHIRAVYMVMTCAGLLIFLPHAASNATFIFGTPSQVRFLIAPLPPFLVVVSRASQCSSLTDPRDWIHFCLGCPYNPSITGRSIGTLQGHASSVTCVKVVDSLNRLFSLSADKVIKVWDIRTNRCFQTITNATNYWPENCLYCLCYDQQKQRIISGSTKPVVFERKNEEVVGIMPIRAALWNSNFMQVCWLLFV